MIFEAIPIELKKENIYYSAKVMGLAITVIPIASFIFYFLKMHLYGAQYATALNLSAYCLTSVLVSSAFLILLDKTLDYKKL